jgi:flagellum-specific ATP synthase
MEINLKKFTNAVENSKPMRMIGKVVQLVGLVIECQGPNVSMGE